MDFRETLDFPLEQITFVGGLQFAEEHVRDPTRQSLVPSSWSMTTSTRHSGFWMRTMQSDTRMPK